MCCCRSGGEGTRWRDGATWWSQAAVGVAGGAKWSRGTGGVAGRAKWSQLAVEAARGHSRGASGGRRAEQLRSMVRASRGTAGGRRAEQRSSWSATSRSRDTAGGHGGGSLSGEGLLAPGGRRWRSRGYSARMMLHVNHC